MAPRAAGGSRLGLKCEHGAYRRRCFRSRSTARALRSGARRARAYRCRAFPSNATSRRAACRDREPPPAAGGERPHAAAKWRLICLYVGGSVSGDTDPRRGDGARCTCGSGPERAAAATGTWRAMPFGRTRQGMLLQCEMGGADNLGGHASPGHRARDCHGPEPITASSAPLPF